MKNYVAEVTVTQKNKYRVRMQSETKPEKEFIKQEILNGELLLERTGELLVFDRVEVESVREFYPGEEAIV